MNTLTVANISQKIAFCCEMRDQIAAGWWSTAKPATHADDWNISWDNVLIGDDIGTTGISPYGAKRNYNFTNSQLLDAVGLQLRFAIAMAKAFPRQVLPLLAEDPHALPSCAEEFFGWIRQPNERTSVAWKKLMTIAKAGITQEMIEEVGTHLDRVCSHKDLRRELKGLKAAMRIAKDK